MKKIILTILSFSLVYFVSCTSEKITDPDPNTDTEITEPGGEEQPPVVDPDPEPDWTWENGYPKGVTVENFSWSLENGTKTCTGVKAVFDFKKNPNLRFNCVKTSGAKKTPSTFMSQFNAKTKGTPVITINGGYFAGVTSVSMVISNKQVLATAWPVFNWPNDEHFECSLYTPRAALGLTEDGIFEIQWAYCTDKNFRRHTAYPDITTIGNNEKERVFRDTPPTDDPEEFPGCFAWNPTDAMGGGPYLVKDGQNIAISSYWHECLDSGGTQALGYAPRTAAGLLPDGNLVLMSCEGRGANGSDGIRLDQLADKFIEWGCVSALNFDGGGSSMMVGPEGDLLITPSDKSGERPVASVVIISEKL